MISFDDATSKPATREPNTRLSQYVPTYERLSRSPLQYSSWLAVVILNAKQLVYTVLFRATSVGARRSSCARTTLTPNASLYIVFICFYWTLCYIELFRMRSWYLLWTVLYLKWLLVSEYCIIGHHCWFVYMVAKRGAKEFGHGPPTLGQDRGSSEDTSHAWLHMASGAMAANSPLGVLGLESTASWNDIKYTYRTLAKQYHPDKCNDPEAKSIFQRLNKAYHVLMNQMCNDNDKQMCDGDNFYDDEGNDTALQPSISMVQRKNCFSVTIDILDMMFLVFVDKCQRHHGVIPIDRG